MSSENLSFVDGNWVFGCGCSGKARTKVPIPVNSKPVFIRKYGILEGPVTHLQYSITPNQVSIDIDVQDALIFLQDKTAVEPVPGQKGRLTRVVNAQSKKE